VNLFEIFLVFFLSFNVEASHSYEAKSLMTYNVKQFTRREVGDFFGFHKQVSKATFVHTRRDTSDKEFCYDRGQPFFNNWGFFTALRRIIILNLDIFKNSEILVYLGEIWIGLGLWSL
jgi:hypothetical protein